MRRLQLWELHDFEWCPKVLRDGLTDFLEKLIEILDPYGRITPYLLKALNDSGASEVVDLCSGAGGPWVHWLRKGFIQASVTLTDKFPNEEAQEHFARGEIRGLRYFEKPVDATAVPPELVGFRTIFTAFHHFPPQQASAIIQDAISKGQPIGIFEFTSRTFSALMRMFLSPIAVWLFTPRMARIGWNKLLFTYLLPLIPLVVTFDGIISCLRTYSVEELRSMACHSGYEWLIGSADRPEGPITYLIGYAKAS